jgi:hypothetical protein
MGLCSFVFTITNPVSGLYFFSLWAFLMGHSYDIYGIDLCGRINSALMNGNGIIGILIVRCLFRLSFRRIILMRLAWHV